MTPHDFRDYDFQVAPIVRSQMINGSDDRDRDRVPASRARSSPSAPTTASGSGRATSAFTSSTAARSRSKKAVCYEPGFLGGVETPMAASGNLVYVPWVEPLLQRNGHGDQERRRPSTEGPAAWLQSIPQRARSSGRRACRALPMAPATVANDVVFTVYARGQDLRLRREDRQAAVRRRQGPAGINSFPAVTEEHADHRRRGFSPSIKQAAERDRRLLAERTAPAGRRRSPRR